jgi:type II secretory pathway pseudopilin PulG
MRKIKIFFLLVVIAIVMVAALGLSPRKSLQQATANSGGSTRLSHSDFQHLLEQYVDADGWVDYDGLSRNREKLNEYLKQLASAQPASFSTDQDRLAFWINSYNAYTLASVLDLVYGKLQGVREAPGFFDKERHAVAGQQLTLDQIEEHARSFHDPRVHFALVCASTSCPELQRFAYVGPDLDAQLARAMEEFLANSAKGVRLDPEHNRIYLSPIFKWYAGDFTGKPAGAGQFLARAKAFMSGNNVEQYVKLHAPEDVARYISEKQPIVGYFDYDWSLNSQRNHPSAKPPTKSLAR